MEREQQAERKPVLRQDFGPGRAGEISYQTILSGVSCGVILPKGDCEDISDRTVGFDVSGNYEFVPVFGAEHEKITRKQVETDLLKAGQIPSFDRNGFGRA